jgi:hypothetical protein
MPLAKPTAPVLQRDLSRTRGLVAGYPLFEGAGNSVADLGPRNNRASLTATSWVGSPFGSALSFNGSTSTLQSNATFPAIDAGDFTVAILFCPTSFPGNYICLFDNTGRDPAAFFNAGGGAPTWFLATGGNNADSIGSITIAINNWYRFVWTRVGTTHTVYINGKISGTSTIAAGTPAAAVVQIGLNPSGGGQKYTGYVAECSTYNRAWSAIEVEQDNLDPFAIYRPRSRWWEVPAAAGTFTNRPGPRMGPAIPFGLAIAGAKALERNPTISRRFWNVCR